MNYLPILSIHNIQLFYDKIKSHNSMINNHLGSKTILIIILSIISLLGHAQTDKVVIEGKSYYVYPHQQAVVGMQEY